MTFRAEPVIKTELIGETFELCLLWFFFHFASSVNTGEICENFYFKMLEKVMSNLPT